MGEGQSGCLMARGVEALRGSSLKMRANSGRYPKMGGQEQGWPCQCRLTVCPSHDSARMLSYQELPTSIEWWRGHGQGAKRGEAGGPRITRNVKRLDRFSTRVRPPGCPCSRCSA